MSTSSVPWVPTVTSSTNLGPLITPLTLPSDCLSKLWDFERDGLQPSAQQSPGTYLTQGCAISSCCPSSAPYSAAYQWLTTYYSPAVCPVSYKNCAGPSNLTPGPSETIVFCCPANYHCPSALPPWWACQSDFSATATMYKIDTFYTEQTVATEVATYNDIWAVAYPIQIRWQQEDLASFSAAAMQLTTKTSSSTETQPVSTSSTAAQNTSGLSTGAKAGIGISVGAIFVVILVAAIFSVRRKRHRPNELDGTGVVGNPEMWVGATLIKIDSSNVGALELNSLNNPNELEGGRAELAGG